MRIPLAGALLDVPGRLLHQADNLRILAKAGLIAPVRPDKLARMALAGARWSPLPARRCSRSAPRATASGRCSPMSSAA
jgi:hypothetical protein